RAGIEKRDRPLTGRLLFLADRAAPTPEIRSHLEAGEIVLCDRYADSTYAYQGAHLVGVLRDPIRFLQRASEGWLLPPDLTILLRVSPEVGFERIKDRPHKIPFEDVRSEE